MRTVKQVSELTGISIRTLQYYDEIGILKPTKLTDTGGLEKIQKWTQFVLQDLTKDPASEEIQKIIKELVEMTEKLYDGMQMGENMWDRMIEDYLHNELMIKTIDKQSGQGASVFIGKAYQCYFKHS